METRIALVTGANRGIGLETVKQLAQKGIGAVLGSRDLKGGQKEGDKLKKQGLPVSVLELDVTSWESIRKAREKIEKDFGRLDILVNNAAVYFDEGKDLHELEQGVFEATLITNLFGPYNLCREFLPMMKKQKYGRIVNVTSGYGQSHRLVAQVGAYKLSKYALNGMTRILADEVNSKQIKINCVCPGWVRTRMGGPNATRDVDTAADGIVWAATLPDDGPSGGFFRDRKPVPW